MTPADLTEQSRNEQLIEAPGAQLPAADLHARFAQRCVEQGLEPPKSPHRLGRTMAELDYKRSRCSGMQRAVYLDVALSCG